MSKPCSGSTEPSLGGRSRTCPKDASTRCPLPRYFSMVFALAGDSTTTSFNDGHSLRRTRDGRRRSSSRQAAKWKAAVCIAIGKACSSPFLRSTDAFALFYAGRVPEALRLIEHYAAAGRAGRIVHARRHVLAGSRRPSGHCARPRAVPAAVRGRVSRWRQRAYTNLLANGSAGLRDWAGSARPTRDEAGSDGLRARMMQPDRGDGS